jgi:hypothetical protein
MTENKTVEIRHRDGRIEKCSVNVPNTPPWRLAFLGAGMENQEFSGRDLFDALNELRKILENKGFQLLCAGARRDVFPSGMSRDMSGGRKAYINRLGHPARQTDLVDIFEYADAELGSVSQQAEFHKQWINSLQK